MSTMTGNTAGGGSGGGKKLKLKLGGLMPAPSSAAAAAAGPGAAPAAAAGGGGGPAAAPSMSTGTVGGSSASGFKKVRLKLAGGPAAAGTAAAAAAAGASQLGAAAGLPAQAAQIAAAAPAAGATPFAAAAQHQDGSQTESHQQQQQHTGMTQQHDPSQQQQYYDPSMQQQYYQQQQLYDAAAWQQQQHAQQYDPSGQHQYDPSMQYQQYQQHDMQYVQQYEQYQQQQQQQQSQKVRLQTKLGLGGAGVQETRYTATGRVQRAASKGIARLIAEEGGVPQDHSLAAPPPNMGYYMESADSPLQERRSTRAVKSKAIDASYVDPDTMDFEGQEWVLPDEPRAKPEKPKREPRPKKPRVERPASESQQQQQQYADDDDFEALDLAMEDDAADEDFDLDMEVGDEAVEVRGRRGSASRAAAAAMAGGQRRHSRRAAAAGVAAVVRAAAAGGEGAYADPAAAPQGYAMQSSHSPSPSAQAWEASPAAAAAAAGGGGKGGGRRRGGSRGNQRAAESDEDYWDLTEESDEGLTAWGGGTGGVDDEDEDGACFGRTVLGDYRDKDYSNLALKPDHYNRPLWVCSDGRIFLETYSPIYKQAYDFLIAIAEPVCRPESIHEYVLTSQSLYAAVSVGLDQQTILSVLDKLSKVKLSSALKNFIASSTRSYGKVKLVLKHNRFWIETADTKVLDKLLSNSVIRAARAWDTPGADARGLVRRAAVKEHAAARLAKLTLAAAAEGAAAVEAAEAEAAGAAAAGAAAGDEGKAGGAAAASAAVPAAAGGAAAAAPPPAAAANVAGGGRFADPFGDSDSESDPEDFTGAQRRQPQAGGATDSAAPNPAGPATAPQAPHAAVSGGPATAAATAAGMADSDDDEDMTQVTRTTARAAPAPAAAPGAAAAAAADAAVDGAAGQPAAAGAAAPAPAPAAAADSDDDSDGLPVVGGSRRRKRQLVQQADAGEASDMSELDEADMEAAAQEDPGGEDAMEVDATQQQQQQQEPGQAKPARRGRLAATAAVAAATNAAAGDGTTQALLALQDGGGGYEDVEEEEDPEKEVLAFEIKAADVEKVKKECLPGSSGLDCPLLEEYDFAHDTSNRGLDIHLKRGVELRPYQEKSLGKMFGNGRARSGIIVLPCGAGKSLVGVAAAARVKKATLVLCTSSVSVDQWAHQFTLWTNLDQGDVVKFVAGGGGDNQAEANKQRLKEACVCVTTFNMIAHKGKRSAYGEEMMRLLSSREWGLLVLDEVHVVPARMFRQVIAIIKAHCKLGLTATLVREDELIGDLNFLIGPKMYEANWLDLTRSGHIANVQCVEVWCPMTKEFFTEYLEREGKNDSIKQLLYVMNPNKFMVCQFLIDWHERVRGDKVIVFSDNVFALETYARALNKPYIYGKTSHAERTQFLAAFKRGNSCNTIFLSKVGDNSLDIPEANVLIQISSHAGSRRQEAQRLGRILRAKKGKPGSAQEEEFSAFFYTLVSRDTQEMYYSAKRQQFLVDQGYAFKVLPNLHVQAQVEDFIQFRRKDEQLQLLNKVINSKELAESLERECGKDKMETGDKYDLVAKQGNWGRGKGRKLGARSMAHASGGSEYVYNEWQRSAGGGKLLSGPQGAVAKQEREARTKKIRQKLVS